MKGTDQLNKLRDMSVAELQDRKLAMSEEDFRLRFQWTMGQSEAVTKLRNLRKERARLLTVLNERLAEQKKAKA
jgi:large subunit ribosomal protein L29